MKPFKFSMQTLLNVRTIKEKQELAQLSLLLGERNRVLQLRDNLKSQFETQARKISTLDPSSPESFQAQKVYYHLEKLIRLEENRVKNELENINKRVLAQQQIIIQKSQEKKVVERLKEKELAEYQVEIKREENIINDDNNQNIWQWKTDSILNPS